MAERARAPFTSMNDVVRRTGLTVPQTEALATAGAFDGFGLSRRQALWNAGYADSGSTLPGTAIDAAPPALPGMSAVELTLADIWATTISPGEHPMQHLRPVLDEQDIVPIARLGEAYADRRVRVAGLVTHRQRPGTAAGITFLNLEDETGMLNVVCSQELWRRFGRVGRNAAGHDHPRPGRARRRGDQPGRRAAAAADLGPPAGRRDAARRAPLAGLPVGGRPVYPSAGRVPVGRDRATSRCGSTRPPCRLRAQRRFAGHRRTGGRQGLPIGARRRSQ